MLQQQTVIVGMGDTGVSCARFLCSQGLPFTIMDSRVTPPGLSDVKKMAKNHDNISIIEGSLDSEKLIAASQIICSPGIVLDKAIVDKVKEKGGELIGDVEVFARHCSKPVIAISGTNAKSTVTAIVYEMAKKSGIRALIGGNYGTPALNLIGEEDCQLYILELSSFQLDLLESLKPKVSALLNVSEDHMDRYKTKQAYWESKQQIYKNSEYVVFNLDDYLTQPSQLPPKEQQVTFNLKEPRGNAFGLRVDNGCEYLSLGDECLLKCQQLKIKGRHNIQNALAALAIGHAYGLPMQPMLDVLKDFSGLSHRCQWVDRHKGVDWINDSKGTNVGATIAALEGFSCDAPNVVLIAGGVGKGADFAPMKEVAKQTVKQLIVFGKDSTLIASAIEHKNTQQVESLAQAVSVASSFAETGDIVLFSPACASFDQYPNYMVRGDHFIELVLALGGDLK